LSRFIASVQLIGPAGTVRCDKIAIDVKKSFLKMPDILGVRLSDLCPDWRYRYNHFG